MNTGSNASKEEPRAQKYTAGKGRELPLGFWDFTMVGKGRERAMGFRTSRSGGERGWTCPHTLCWMETGEASTELETPPWSGGAGWAESRSSQGSGRRRQPQLVLSITD